MFNVSVVIPTHNRPDKVVRAVQSVYEQDYKDYEVIVVDDGDCPRAHQVLEPFLTKDNFTYLETKKDQGAPVARNMGIKISKGKYVAFLDDDDIWVPQKLLEQVTAFEDAPNDVGFSITGALFKQDTTSYVTHVLHGVHDFSDLILTNFKGFLTVTQMVRRDVLEEVGGFDEQLPSHQDPELMIRITRRYKGLGIDKPLSVVSAGSGRDSIGSSVERRIKGRLMVIEKHRKLYVGNEDKLARLYFQIGLWYRALEDYEQTNTYMKLAYKHHRKLRYLLHLVRAQIYSFFVPKTHSV